MPQGAIFDIPFPSLINSYLAPARAANLDWVRDRGLARSEARMEEYLSWDLPQLTARTYPYADRADLEMLMNFFSIFFLFDDEFDIPQGDRRAHLAAAIQEMITIPFRPPGAPPDIVCPITLAWVEVWTDIRRGMSEAWQNLFASNSARFLTASLEEERLASSAVVLDLNSYVVLRRQSVGVYHGFDLAERSRGFEVPPQAQTHQRMRDLRAAATDAIGFMNDVHSLERDERRGKSYNLVTVLQREHRCSRADAIDRAMRMAHERLNTAIRLQAKSPYLCGGLVLSGDERVAVEWGVEGIRNWIRGYYDWACQSRRYAASCPIETTLGSVRHEDDLLADLKF
jgi:Terpene synthase family 2, C-terminal metal binding